MTDTFYAVRAVDKGGRVADRNIVRVLGWMPGARLEIREQAGIVIAHAARDGVHLINGRGFRDTVGVVIMTGDALGDR